MAINILLVEDHKLVRDGIRMLLESEECYNVVDEADNAESALRFLANRGDIDVVLTDIHMEGMDGISLTRKMKELYPPIKIIVLSMVNDHLAISKCFEAGADAYLIKSSDYKEFKFAIKHVANGGKYICEMAMMGMMQRLQENNRQDAQSTQLLSDLELTERELEILQLIGEGYTNNEIAEKLFLSKRTVEGHRQHLIDKTNVRNSAQLVKYAVKHGLI